jgi:hypothetical protein
MSEQKETAIYVTIDETTVTVAVPSDTEAKTERGLIRVDKMKSGEHGSIWAKPNGEKEFRWVQIQRAYFLSIDLSAGVKPWSPGNA